MLYPQCILRLKLPNELVGVHKFTHIFVIVFMSEVVVQIEVLAEG